MELLKILFVTALCVAGSSAKIKEEDGIMIVTKDNFEEVIEDTYVLIEFYAPWCGSCTKFAPQYVELAKALKETELDVKLGKVDTTEEPELAQMQDIQSYPTLKLFRDGVPIKYQGNLEVSAVLNWLTKKATPPAEEIKSIRGAKKFINKHEIAIIGFFKDFESKEAETFWHVANANGDYGFGFTNTESVFKEFKAEDGQVILFKNFDERQNVYKKKMDAKKLEEFIEASSIPLIVDYDEKIGPKVFGGSNKDFLVAFLSEDDGDYDNYAEEFTKTAKKYRGKMMVVTFNVDEPEQAQMLDFIGLKMKDVPAMRIIKVLDKGIHKYKPENPELKDKNIYDFASKYFKGEVKRYLSAEDVPEDWDAKPVKVLTGKNFKKIAMDKSKHVLVEFYAPWCGHCKQLAPIYDELAEKYKNDKKVVIAKLDATANELEDIDIQGYPTLVLFKKGTNEVIYFEGNRTVEGMSKFIDSDGVEGAKEEEEEDEKVEAKKGDEEGLSKDEL
ncbi:GSCOCT00005214001.2-RA-CDS [Cotesia congregata]|uniref:Protein disulfide-isomerase n=1 Tax=Cotesia congregata TaxID=51543 RepID=A0A8J2MPI7_COTCN|nr:GSCOCT00005214001.2-RA-CDS [Cotesia congregata]CAG5101882.1 Putative venom protein 28 [Cotesia congregata]